MDFPARSQGGHGHGHKPQEDSTQVVFEILGLGQRDRLMNTAPTEERKCGIWEIGGVQ